MGNQESSTSEGEIAERDERKSSQLPETVEHEEPPPPQPKQTHELEYLNYDDIYLEEAIDTEDEEDGEDGEKDDSNENLSVFPSSVSNASRVQNFTARLILTISYVQPRVMLIVKLEGTTDVPGKGQGGSAQYQMVMKLIADEPEEFISKIRTGPNPEFNDTWEVKLAKVQLPRATLECQLYGCVNGERNQQCGEGIVDLSKINTRIQNRMVVRLNPKFSPPSMYSAQSIDHESMPAWSEVTESSRYTKTHSVAPSSQYTKTHSVTPSSHYTKTASIAPTEADTIVSHHASQQQTGKVKFNVEEQSDEQPNFVRHQVTSAEILLNASYNPTTGKFECMIQKAHGLYRPGRTSKSPSPFVRIQFSDSNGKVLAEGDTQTVKHATDPSFHEILVFNVSKEDIDTVTLLLTVYHKPAVANKLRIGMMSMGMQNTSDTEREHWEDIMDAQGQRVARWHRLYLA